MRAISDAVADTLQIHEHAHNVHRLGILLVIKEIEHGDAVSAGQRVPRAEVAMTPSHQDILARQVARLFLDIIRRDSTELPRAARITRLFDHAQAIITSYQDIV